MSRFVKCKVGRCLVGCVAGLLFAACTSAANAAVVVVSFRGSSDASATGGTFDGGSTPGSQLETSNGFIVSGNYSVTADGTSGDILVTIDTKLFYSSLPASDYIIGASIDGLFSSSLGASSIAFVSKFENDTNLLDQSLTPVSGSLAVAGGDFSGTQISNPAFFTAIQLSQSPQLLSAGFTGPLTLAAGDYTLHQLTTIDIAGVQAGEDVVINLPVNSSITPAPSTITMLWIAGVMYIGACAWQRRRELSAM